MARSAVNCWEVPVPPLVRRIDTSRRSCSGPLMKSEERSLNPVGGLGEKLKSSTITARRWSSGSVPESGDGTAAMWKPWRGNPLRRNIGDFRDRQRFALVLNLEIGRGQLLAPTYRRSRLLWHRSRHDPDFGRAERPAAQTAASISKIRISARTV